MIDRRTFADVIWQRVTEPRCLRMLLHHRFLCGKTWLEGDLWKMSGVNSSERELIQCRKGAICTFYIKTVWNFPIFFKSPHSLLLSENFKVVRLVLAHRINLSWITLGQYNRWTTGTFIWRHLRVTLVESVLHVGSG